MLPRKLWYYIHSPLRRKLAIPFHLKSSALLSPTLQSLTIMKKIMFSDEDDFDWFCDAVEDAEGWKTGLSTALDWIQVWTLIISPGSSTISSYMYRELLVGLRVVFRFLSLEWLIWPLSQIMLLVRSRCTAEHILTDGSIVAGFPVILITYQAREKENTETNLRENVVWHWAESCCDMTKEVSEMQLWKENPPISRSPNATAFYETVGVVEVYWSKQR